MTKTSNNEKVITKKDLIKMFWRSLPMEFSWHYERQMHMGFCSMISAGLKKIYRNDPKGLSEALQRHLEFFNITPHVSTFVGGITLAMEEMNATQEDFDSSSINAVKAALMGPLSGIGDSLLLGTLRVLAIYQCYSNHNCHICNIKNWEIIIENNYIDKISDIS